ncbi:MAG: penicillin acylase family protein [Myxococcales bacterium]|nr:penicillin acylase family protein [Myxococcales bacterium]
MPSVEGPWGLIEFHRDEWGYPRVRVRDPLEAAWAAGYFHGRDRHTQVQLTLLAGRGRLMEVLGDFPLLRGCDRATRGIGVARGLAEQVARVRPEVRVRGERYCEGFNAGASASRRGGLLTLLGARPRPYGLEDLLLVYRMLAWFGLNSLTQTASETIGRLVGEGLSREQLALLLGAPADDVDLETGRGVAWPSYLKEAYAGGGGGSNAFAVSGARTLSGAPLMMCEFHMEVGRFPPIVYAMHFDLPDGEFVHGVSVPGLPAIVAGRNRHVGWTYTFGHARNIDVRIERCEGGRRLVGEEWRPLTRRVESVKVRRVKAREEWVFWDSEDGSIHGDAAAGGLLPSIGWRGMQDAYVDFNAISDLYAARSVEDVITRHRAVRALSVACVTVDAAGRVGYIQTGSVPADPRAWGPRPGWELGDDPDLDPAQRPECVDPPEGFVTSANEARPPWTAFAEPPHRQQRIAALLAEGPVAPDDMVRISYDEYDRLAAWLMPVWAPHLPADPRARALITWARRQGWRRAPCERDLHERFHVLHREAQRVLLSRRLGAQRSDELLDNASLLIGIQHELDRALALERPEQLQADELAAVLAEAWPRSVEVMARPGLHAPVRQRARFTSMFTGGREPAVLGLSSREIELPGGPVSVFQSRLAVVGGHEFLSGPAFHVLIDMSSTVSQYNIAGGASERWRGPGYGAAIEAWRSGQLIALGGDR